MMKKFYLSALLVGTTAIAIAQASDPAAKAILDGVSAKFKTFTTVQATFTYKVENAAGKALSTKTGTILMKGTKYKVTFSGQEIFCNGTTIWNYDKLENEVTISKLDASSGMVTPQKLFTNFYDKDFLYKLNGVATLNGKKLKEVELTPVDKTKPFFKVLLYVDKSAINTTKIFEKNGSRYTYSTSSFKPNVVIADATFLCFKLPSVEK